jgi:arachidonate 5-lipoxygenase
MFEVIRDMIGATWARFHRSRAMMILMRPVIIFLITLKAVFLRQRMSHENGFVTRGRVRIVDDLDLPENAFFKPGRAFACRLRHASVSFLDDAGLVVRGASLKFADNPTDSPLDLLMNTGTAAPFWNMDTFWQFTLGKLRGGRAQLIGYFQRNPRCYMNVRAAVRRDPSSYADQHYHSQTPLRFAAEDGKLRYAKFRLLPRAAARGKAEQPDRDGRPAEDDLEMAWFQEALSHEPRSRNYLKDEYHARLSDGGKVEYILQIQLLEWQDGDDRAYELSSLYPWDGADYPWRDLAEVTIDEALGYHEGNQCYFALTNLPPVLQVIPAQGYEDGPSLDFLRLGGIVPRKARLFMYRILGQRPPIPNERPETAVDYADHTVATFDSADIYTAPCLPGAARGLDAHERGQQLEAARGGYQYLHGYVETGAPAPRGKTWNPPAWYRRVFAFYDARPTRTNTRALPLPPFVRQLLPEEQYSVYIQGRLYKMIGASVLSLALSFVENWLKARHGLAAYRHLFFGYKQRPSTEHRWREDSEFARQRLDGINPGIIRRFDKVPRNFPVTDAILRGLLDPGETIASAIKAKRLYVCDYRLLEGISVHEGRYLARPIALFYAGTSGRLMPVAIQLYQTPEKGPIFTPKDDPGLWLAVKTYVQSADAQLHEVVEHLLHGHLIVEVFDVAIHRTLAKAHPIFQLVAPHLEYTMAVNSSARNVMLAPGGPIDRTMAVGAKGAFELLARAWAEEWDFSRHNIRHDIAARGVEDAAALPGYHWREDALRLWDIIEGYVTAMVAHFYPDDATVRADVELQALHAELRSERGGNVRGLPGGGAGFADRTTLVEVLTRLIYTASAGHAAGNNGQFDIYGFVPNVPGALYRPPPADKALAWTEVDLARAMPGFRAASVQILMVRFLSRPTEMPLGRFPQSFFAGTDTVWPIVRRFRRELHALSQDIARRNAGLEVPYTYLDPAQVACSITA